MTPPNGWDQGISAEVLAAYERMLAQHGGKPNVSGVDIGFVESKGSEVLGVRVHLKMNGATPAIHEFPFEEDGVRIVALQAEYERHPLPRSRRSGGFRIRPAVPASLANAPSGRTGRVRPIQPGISISHPSTQGGTLGLIVLDRDMRLSMLTCHHVLCPPPKYKKVKDVVQPSAPGNGVVGTRTDQFQNVSGDAAIAQITVDGLPDPAQFGTAVVIKIHDVPRLKNPVEKSGVGTEVTNGFVDGQGRYYLNGCPDCGMDGFRILPNAPQQNISAPGDSGSVWYRTNSCEGLGIHVGGDTGVADPDSRPAIACYLQTVLTCFGATIRRCDT